MSKQNAAGAAPQENKMGVLPVGKLLAGMAVPMMISMPVSYTHLRRLRICPALSISISSS